MQVRGGVKDILIGGVSLVEVLTKLGVELDGTEPVIGLVVQDDLTGYDQQTNFVAKPGGQLVVAAKQQRPFVPADIDEGDHGFGPPPERESEDDRDARLAADGEASRARQLEGIQARQKTRRQPAKT